MKKRGKFLKRPIVKISLIVIFAVFVGIFLYAFVIKPVIYSYALSNYRQGVQDAVMMIMQQALACKSIKFPLGNNQTMDLMWVDCINFQKNSSQLSQFFNA
jgi:hypothetical protein